MKKRIALGVVAALAGGLLAVAPASAVATAATPFGVTAAEYAPTDSYAATATVSQVAGANNYVAFTAGANVASGQAVVTVSGGTIVAKVDAGGGQATGTLNTAANVLTYSSNLVNGNVFWVGTPTAGKITVTVARRDFTAGVATDTTLQTFTINVNAAATANIPVAANSTSIINIGADNTAAADETVIDSSLAGQVANIAVTIKDGNLVGTTKDVVATVSGPGTIGISDTNGTVNALSAGRAVSTITADGIVNVSVWADGTAGVGTITISSNSTVIATEKVTFYGAATSYTATVTKAYVADGAGPVAAIAVVAKDANGVVVPSQPLTITSSDSTVASAAGVSATQADSELGTATVSVTGVATKSGKVTFTIKNAAGTVSTTADVTISSAKAAKIAMALDKASYAPGEKATVTLTATDANGLPVADGALVDTLAGALTTSTGVTSTLFGADVTFKNGKATATFFAPLVSGPFTLAGTVGAGANVATAIQATALTASAAVAQSADVAAQQAAISALQTSVASLQTTVASLVASMTAQIKVINAALKKIAKKLQVKL